MTVLAHVVAALRAEGHVVTDDAPFGALTTYGTGGCAAAMVETTDQVSLASVASVVAAHPGVEVFVLGNGSNTLVADGGFDGLVIRPRPPTDPDAARVEVRNGMVEVPAWMPLPVLARRSVAAGACGLEWAVGVPGTVGGAVRMNAGGHGSEMIDDLVGCAVTSLRSGRTEWVEAGLLGLHFRGSVLCDWHVVASARLCVREPNGHDCAAEIASIVAWRREHQPGGRNAGSVFVNPAPGTGSSGALIDRCGLRGLTVGGATVSDKHANFVQAAAGATAADILAVMTVVRERVEAETGTRLASETRLVGFDPAVAERFRRDDSSASHPVEATRRLCTALGEAS